jgi:hypothetical protein
VPKLPARYLTVYRLISSVSHPDELPTHRGRMRLAAAIGVIAITLSAAVFVHQRHVTGVGCTMPVPVGARCIDPAKGVPGAAVLFRGYLVRKQEHPSWEDPIAVLLSLGGIAVGAGILATGRPALLADGTT